MSSELESLREQVEALSRRIEALEWSARIRDTKPGDGGATQGDLRPSAHEEPEPVESGDRAQSPARFLPTPVIESAASAPTIKRPSSERAANPLAIEQLVGARTFGIAGGVIVVLAAGLFLKLAWEEGWLATIPDTVKCGICWTIGLALIALGEILRKRINVLASMGLFIAGLGVVYVTSWASFGFFQIVEREIAFVLLAATALLGIGIALRARLRSIGALSLVCGYLAPILLQSGVDPPPIVLPTYWTTLLLVAIGVSLPQHVRFTAMRVGAVWATVVFGALWTLNQGIDHALITLPFLALAWLIVHLEVAYITVRSETSVEAAESPTDEIPTPVRGRNHDFAMSVVLTAWATLFGYLTLERFSPGLGWLAPAGAFSASALGAVALAGGLRFLKDMPIKHSERIGAALAAQAGALLLITIALAAAPWMESVAWLALGLTCVVIGRLDNARSLVTYGVITLALASMGITSLAWWVSAAPGVDALGIHLTRWSAMPALAALCWCIAGAMPPVTDSERRLWLPAPAAFLGAIFLFASILHSQSAAPAVATVWLLLSVALAASAPMAARMRFDHVALAGLLATGLAWAFAYHTSDALLTSGQFGRSALDGAAVAYAPMLHPSLGLGCAFSIAGLVVAERLRRRVASEQPIAQLMLLVFLGSLLLSTSLEIARSAELITNDETSRRAVVSIWWSLFAFALLVLGFARRVAPIRYVGLTLLAVAGAKTVIFDLAFVDAGWRIASLLGVGALMLLVAVGYARVSSRLEDGSAADVAGDKADQQ